jgi:PadR family transcriptional regulator, regulatory protein AphA
MDVRTICLGILTRGDATGYEIKKLSEDDGYEYFIEASFGSIYPALSRLTQEDLVSVREETQEKRPDRKVYSITKAGRSAFAASLLKPLPEDRYRSPFLFAMLFADLLPDTRVAQMFDDYTAYAEAKLSQLQQTKAEPRSKGERFVRDFGRAMYLAMLENLHHHRNEFQPEVAKAAE